MQPKPQLPDTQGTYFDLPQKYNQQSNYTFICHIYSYACVTIGEPANNPVKQRQKINVQIFFDTPCKIAPNTITHSSSTLPKQEPMRERMKKSFRPYKSLPLPIIRRPWY